jgi:predicted DNA binding protein
MINEHAATAQKATAANGEWQLHVLFSDRNALSATNEFAKENDIGFTLERIYGPENFETTRHNLTNLQHETLALAVEKGYYEVPREIDAKGLADELDISHQALSERHRRATKNLVLSALATVDGEKHRNKSHHLSSHRSCLSRIDIYPVSSHLTADRESTP